MRTKDRRRRYVFGVDLHRLAVHIWNTLGTGGPLPEIEWWMTSSSRPHGLAWTEESRMRIYIPWHRPHICLVAELILHEMCHCALPADVDDHGPEFQALLTTTAKDLWGVDPYPEHLLIGNNCDPEYMLDRQIEAALMLAYVDGFLYFEEEHGERPEVCRKCDTTYAGPTRCCGRPTKPLEAEAPKAR